MSPEGGPAGGLVPPANFIPIGVYGYQVIIFHQKVR